MEFIDGAEQLSLCMSFTANAEGGKYNVDLKHYHTSSAGYDNNLYFMGKPTNSGPDQIVPNGYGFSADTFEGEIQNLRLFGTSYALEEKSVLQPYKVIYRWRRTA